MSDFSSFTFPKIDIVGSMLAALERVRPMLEAKDRNYRKARAAYMREWRAARKEIGRQPAGTANGGLG